MAKTIRKGDAGQALLRVAAGNRYFCSLCDGTYEITAADKGWRALTKMTRTGEYTRVFRGNCKCCGTEIELETARGLVPRNVKPVKKHFAPSQAHDHAKVR